MSAPGLLHTTNDIVCEGIMSFHEQMLDHAKTSLRMVSVEKRAAKEMIREFKAKFSRTFEEQEGDETYQFQIQFFHLQVKDKY